MVFNIKKCIRKFPNENLRKMAWVRAFTSMTQTNLYKTTVTNLTR